ncbi:hypothetical protein [Nocardiopsis nanhaiensis]
MPRTSRTGALRAVSVARAVTPAFIGLPLLVGAFLAVLWLFLAAPAQAETDAGGDGTAVTGILPQNGERDAEQDRETGLGEAPDLERIVPEEVTEPVTDTLGTVHQGLEDTAAAATSRPAPASLSEVGGEVRGEVRDVVQEIDRTREDAAEGGLVPALPVTGSSQPAPSSVEEAEPEQEESAEDTEDAQGTEAPEADTGPTGSEHASALTQHHRSMPAATAAPVESVNPADRASEHHHTLSASGTAAPTANGPAPAPAVAGYLSSALLPAPVSDAVPLAAHRLHPVPADAADDPTVSPD